jgi:hypothetical protein
MKYWILHELNCALAITEKGCGFNLLKIHISWNLFVPYCSQVALIADLYYDLVEDNTYADCFLPIHLINS